MSKYQVFIIRRRMPAAYRRWPVPAFDQNAIGGIVILMEGTDHSVQPAICDPVLGGFKELVRHIRFVCAFKKAEHPIGQSPALVG